MNRTSPTLNLILALLGTLAIFCFDAKTAKDLFHQYEAVSFPTATGKVYYSAVSVTHSSKGGTHYSINIMYDFEVDGRKYSGNRYRYSLFSPGSTQAYAAVNAHPVGSDITVHYRADNPEDSVLSPGVVGRDFLIFFLLVPASAFMLYLLGAAETPGWVKLGNRVAGGVPVFSQGSQIRVRLPRYTVWRWTVATLCITSLAAFFTLTITTQRNSSFQPELETWALILTVTAGVFLWRRARILAGVDDLVINEDARTIVLPQTFGRKHPVSLNFQDVQSVFIEPVSHRGRYGYYYTWAVTLMVRDALASPERLAHWTYEEKSQDFAAWLSERLHIPQTAARLTAPSSAFSLSSSLE